MNYAFRCEASGRVALPDLANRIDLAERVFGACLDAEEDHLHGLKLLNRVRKNCGLGPMEVLSVISFIIQLIRLFREWRQNKDEQESEGGHA